MLTTLHISSQEIKLAAISGRKVKCWTSRTLDSGIVRDGRVLDPERLGETIAQLFKTQKVPRNKIVATLSGLPYTYRIIGFPLIKESQVEEAIRRALPEELTMPIEDLYLSWARLLSGPEGSDYFVLGVDRDLVDALIQAMRLAGIKDWTMDLKPLALARAANTTDAIIASLDYDHMDIVLVRGGYIKELHSAVPNQEERRTNFNRYMEQFVAELVKILSFHHDTAGDVETEKALSELPILVTGEMVVPALAEGELPDEDKTVILMSKLTGHNVSLIMPPVTGPETFNATAYATNIGLFLKTHRRRDYSDTPDHFHDVNIDILAGLFAKKPVVVPMWYTVAPVVVFLVVFGAWSFNSAYSKNNTEITKLRAEMEQLTITQTQMQKQAAEQARLEKQYTTSQDTLKLLQQQHRSLLAGKGNDPVFVSDFRSCLPTGASLTEIKIGDKDAQLQGNVNDPFDVITYIRSLERAGYTINLQEIGESTEGQFTFFINVDITGGKIIP